MQNKNTILKKEADQLLHKYSLGSLLQEFSSEQNIYVSGSYMLDLMVWRDLDIYIDLKGITQDEVYALITKVMEIYRPVWLETKDSFNEETGCPKGYFLGFETKIINDELWNVDIWITNKDYIVDHLKYMKGIVDKLDLESRNIIMKLKEELIKVGVYGNEVFSVDIYDAVLFKGLKTVEEILKK